MSDFVILDAMNYLAFILLPFGYYIYDGTTLVMQYDTGSVSNLIYRTSPSYNRFAWSEPDGGGYAKISSLKCRSTGSISESLILFPFENLANSKNSVIRFPYIVDGILGCHFLSKNKLTINIFGKCSGGLPIQNNISSEFSKRFAHSTIIERVYIKVKLDGNLVCMILDTGSPYTLLDSRYSEGSSRIGSEINLLHMASGSEYTLTKTSVLANIITDSGIVFPICIAYCGNLDRLKLKSYDNNVPCVGLIGNDIINKYKIHVDFDREKVFVAK